MAKVTLTQARVKALRPRRTTYDIRDGELRGFGVRVPPSGRKRFFIQCQREGQRVWKIVGDAGTIDVREARSRAAEMMAAIRRRETAPRGPDEVLFEAVAETVFRRYERVWKARTFFVNRCYLRKQILPCFSGRRIAEIDRRDVGNWFASLRETPAAADRSMPVLSVIMKEAEAMGLRPEGSNPCLGIRRYRRKGREALPVRRRDPAFVREAIGPRRAFAAAGRRHPPASPDRMPQGGSPDAPLVGLPRGPSVPSRQQDRAPNRLVVAAGQAHSRYAGTNKPLGLSRIPPGSAPRQYLAAQFSGTGFGRRRTCATSAFTTCAIRMRASHSGRAKPLVAIGRLLGHADPETTLKYTHLADRAVMEAAERVGVALGG